MISMLGRFRFLIAVMGVWLVFVGHVWSAQGDKPEASTDAAGIWAGKTIWVVDVNTNDYYTGFLQQAIVEQLPQFAPGAIVRHVITAAKGNPFFLLKQADYPDAVIIALGMCEASSKNVVNFASEARKKKIPALMIYFAEVREPMVKWMKTYRTPEDLAIESEQLPQSEQEAAALAKGLIPKLFDKLKQ